MKKIYSLLLLVILASYMLLAIVTKASIPQTATLITSAINETDNAAQFMHVQYDVYTTLQGPVRLIVVLPYGVETVVDGKVTAFSKGTIEPITVTVENIYFFGTQTGDATYAIRNGPALITSGTITSSDPIIATLQGQFKSVGNTLEALIAPALPGAPTPHPM